METSEKSWRYLWNHIMNNVQVKPGQCDSVISPEAFSFESCQYILDIFLAGSYLLDIWQVLESIHKFIIEIRILQFTFVRGSNKKQRRGNIISSFKNGETFHILWEPSAIVDNLTIWHHFRHLPRKAFFSPSLWPRRDHT